MSDKLAIITPVFNGEDFVSDCINSVRFSNCGNNLEIIHIVVDDGSTDNSWKIIDDADVRNGIKIKLDKNYGGSYARNTAIARTDANYIFCLDADDVVFQHSFVNLFDFMKLNNFDWVYGDFLKSDKNLKYLTGQDYWGTEFESIDQVLTAMFSGEHFFQQNCMYTRKAFEASGGFNENYRHFQDFELFTRMLIAGYHPKHLRGPLYIHRFHDNNLSKIRGAQDNPELHKQDIRDLFSAMKTELESKLNPEQLAKINKFISD